MTIKRVNYQNDSDQCLIDSFKQSRNQNALAVLYARYRVSLGNYLNRRIKKSRCATKTFNSIVTQLLVDPSKTSAKSSVATSLFALAYRQRSNFSEQKKSAQPNEVLDLLNNGSFHHLTDLQSDVIELVYKLNFTPAEAAEIIGGNEREVQHCLAFINKHNQSILDTLKRSRPLCQITKIAHPPAAKQEPLIHSAS